MNEFRGILEHIGRTPLVPLRRLAAGLPVLVLVKCEHMNPGGSVKDRIALAIVADAEARGLLAPGATLIEATAGNTGVGLALVAAARGYKLVCVMPEKMSVDKRVALVTLGAQVIITPNAPPSSADNFRNVARRLAEERGWFLTDQFCNPANVRVHAETTAVEILEQTGGRIGAFVAGAGTGGTISGVGLCLKAQVPGIRIVLADPVGSALADWVETGQLGPDGSYAVEGIGGSEAPANLHRAVIDAAERVTDEESFAVALRLIREEGLLGAMSGLPKMTQVRSVSKYGLSVVTVVFDDDTNIYFARQLINERMREASEAVPAAYGTPEMGPISTGLGEIFQFTVRSEKHSLMELEELLDWYIGPQLRSVPGVVETNSFGGENRQYQIVLRPERLQAMHLSVGEVAEALEQSNANAGGGYIERNQEQLVIGSNGLVRSREDLERVVLGATPQGVPITVSSVGEVRFGPKLRRGAATQDGEGEVVVGVALMLMGENSRTVTQGIKDKLAALEPTLPEGVRIEPFYDRTRLVDRTIATVGTNLLEGAALVVLVLLLVLGDLRAGLVVATTIPLAMLFAVIVMNATGLSGNLMSLGAIDFGLIVDGSVIVVENAARCLSEASRRAGRRLPADERMQVIQDSTVEVRGAAVFGEIIIAIVYLPILALTGMEGKLFHPMAFTVLLALGGAFIVSLTVVPVLTSYFVKPHPDARETLLVRMVHHIYTPALHLALRWRWVTMTAGLMVLAAGIALFGRLGAQFVPQLDEGDLLVEARRMPGSSLSASVATSLRLERALKEIPEITHVVSRTGSPEVATDPMGVEQSDVYVQLRDRAEWRPGLTKDQIADEMSELVESVVPEVAGAISQPIQMRTNELVAGVRSDVGIIVYGPDLETLRKLGQSIVEQVRGIPGVTDARAEQLQGLQYLRIEPDRAKLARYGLTIADINLATEAIAVGHQVGTVLEGERRFDMMVKFDPALTSDLGALSTIPLRSKAGKVVPLGDVATFQETTGPVLVNREKQSRRVIVEFNVRGRDLVSTVEGAQAVLAEGAELPVGYRIEYGGTFEHYIAARDRLAVVVPLALALILFMLWTALRTMRAALIIFLNVPFAIIGGVIALWLRGLPFSISAGVGFIALFGVAMLNGLVLVTFCQRLQSEGVDRLTAIGQAAELRLRPVLTTALVAALGFIPMALSTAPGSEVQRPLATVVIGGLISASLLTLLVLPAVYARFGPRTAARTPA